MRNFEEQPIRGKKIAPLLLSAVALAGCGASGDSKSHAQGPEKNKPQVAYTQGMRIWQYGGTIIVDLCRGKELVHEVMRAVATADHHPKEMVSIHTHKPDDKCLDEVITPNDFHDSVSITTTTSTI